MIDLNPNWLFQNCNLLIRICYFWLIFGMIVKPIYTTFPFGDVITNKIHNDSNKMFSLLGEYSNNSKIELTTEIIEVSKLVNHEIMAITYTKLLELMKKHDHIHSMHLLKLAGRVKNEIINMKNAEKLNCLTNNPEICVKDEVTSILEILEEVKDNLPTNVKNLMFGRICLRTNALNGYLYANYPFTVDNNEPLVWKTREKSALSKIELELFDSAYDTYRLKYVELNKYLTIKTENLPEHDKLYFTPPHNKPNFVHIEASTITTIYASSKPTYSNVWTIKPVGSDLTSFYLKSVDAGKILYTTDTRSDFWNAYVYGKDNIDENRWSEFVFENC